ncbi:DUF2628 domain-containing protein [Aerococcus sp. UMB7834]|uniref:DUF2628 domain-containing protein n=1 Tax=Aerococcus sp. UMB7834 TaxID=3046342 RepID=UPI00254BF212|nr:DUF2628 domain-containing protein [Aerococcus sp. UMB7834]MDK6805379.1 DUF2628 domain-containing protein [Aerococcus sp. UMB7834]
MTNEDLIDTATYRKEDLVKASAPKAYCTHCGYRLHEQASYCYNCDQDPLTGTAYCRRCGGSFLVGQKFCSRCGLAQANSPSVHKERFPFAGETPAMQAELERIEASGDKDKGCFNIWAFIFNGLWFCYQGLWEFGLVLIILICLPFAFWLKLVLIAFFSGRYANYIKYRYLKYGEGFPNLGKLFQ